MSAIAVLENEHGEKIIYNFLSDEFLKEKNEAVEKIKADKANGIYIEFEKSLTDLVMANLLTEEEKNRILRKISRIPTNIKSINEEIQFFLGNRFKSSMDKKISNYHRDKILSLAHSLKILNSRQNIHTEVALSAVDLDKIIKKYKKDTDASPKKYQSWYIAQSHLAYIARHIVTALLIN